MMFKKLNNQQAQSLLMGVFIITALCVFIYFFYVPQLMETLYGLFNFLLIERNLVAIILLVVVLIYIYDRIGKSFIKNKKINVSDIKLSVDEKIEHIYYPKSVIKSPLFAFDKRTSLIITNKRLILRRIIKYFDKQIDLQEISDVLIYQYCLDILKKGKAPSAFIFYEEEIYYPFMRCAWLSSKDLSEACNLIKDKIKSR